MALLSECLSTGPDDVKPIVVGGFALEFYSTGGYATSDVDVLYLWPAKAGALLETLGFRKVNRHWVHDGFGLQIEFPGHAIEKRALAHLADVRVSRRTVRVIGVEDLILDRLNLLVHAGSSDDGRWALELLVMYRDRLDLAYLREQSRLDRTAAALRKLEKSVH